MNKIPDDVFKKLEILSKQIKKKFRKKGLVIPVNNQDGSISIGLYQISKDSQGFYTILNYANEVIADKINLPQTALLLANKLALGQHLDQDLLMSDRRYGYAVFEEKLIKKTLSKRGKNPVDRFDLITTKCLIAEAKKTRLKNEINRHFEKLRKLV